jgi:hypothetical protein
METASFIAQVIFTPIALLLIYFHQGHRIKNLKEQLDGNKEILGSIKTYFDILNPEMLNYRVELYEKTVEKQMKMDLDKMESKLLKRTDDMNHIRNALIKSNHSAIKAISGCFVFVPHSQRIQIVSEMKDDSLRDILRDSLPGFREMDSNFRKKARGLLPPGMAPTSGMKPT